MRRARLALLAVVPILMLVAGHLLAWRAARSDPAADRARLLARAEDAERRFAAFVAAAHRVAARAGSGGLAHAADELPERWRGRLEGAGVVRAGSFATWIGAPAEPGLFPGGREASSRIVTGGMRTSLLVRGPAEADGSFGAASFALELGDESAERVEASLSRSAGSSSLRWVWLAEPERDRALRYDPGPPAVADAPLEGDGGATIARVVVEDRSPASRAAGALARVRAWTALVAAILAALALLRRPRPVDSRRLLTVLGALAAGRMALAAARTCPELLPRDLGSPSLYGRVSAFGLLSSPAALAATALAGYLAARSIAAWARASEGRARRAAAAIVAGGAAAALIAVFALAASLPRDVRLAVPRLDLSSGAAVLLASALGLALAGAAELLAAAGAGAVTRGRILRPGALVVAATLVPVAALALVGMDAASRRVVDERLRSEFAPLVLDQASRRRVALGAAVAEAASDPRTIGDLAGQPSAAEGFLAHRLWSSSDLFHQGFVSSIDLYDASGRRRSHFGFGLPLLSDPRETSVPAEGLVDIEVLAVGASLERLLHAVAIVRGASGEEIGRVVGHVLDDPSNLPFLPTSAPYLQALGKGPFASASPLLDPPDYVLYDEEGHVVLSTLAQPPAPSPELRQAADAGRFVEVRAGDFPYRALPLGDGPRLHLLLAPAPTSLDRAADLVRLLLLGLAVVACAAAGGTLLSPGGAAAFAALVRGSFYRKLLASVLTASVVPLVGLAFVLRGTIETRGEEALAESASTVVGAARRVVEDYQSLGEEDPSAPPVHLTDETLSWVRRLVGQEIHLYEDGVIAATSKPELFDSGLLRPRLPGEVERAVIARGQPYLVRSERWGPVTLTVAYARVDLAAGPADAVLAVPLVSEQRERSRAVDRLFQMLLLGTAALVAVLAASSALLARSVAGPVRRLALASRRIAEGDYAPRLVARSHDEMGSLVTDFNRMAQALSDQRADLTRRRDYIEALVRHATAGVVSTDARGTIVTVNPAARTLLRAAGCDPEPGDDLLEALARAEATKPLAAALEERAAHGGEPIEVDLQENDRLVRLRLVRVPLPDPAGGDTGTLVLLDDVTSLMKSNQLAAWAEMARAIAHEVKNPLTPVQLSAEHIRRLLADRGVLPDPAVEACLDTIVRQVRDLRDISTAFSTYARLPDLILEPTDPAALLREIAAPYRAAPPDGVSIEERHSGAPSVAADRRILARAIVNLVENALQAMPRGGRLTLATAAAPGGGALLSVSDTGRGLDPAARERLFEPYFSTKSSGTGLGLAIVRRVVEAHGGAIEVTTAPGAGTTFVIRLPASSAA